MKDCKGFWFLQVRWFGRYLRYFLGSTRVFYSVLITQPSLRLVLEGGHDISADDGPFSYPF
jgi:hypothetical protein